MSIVGALQDAAKRATCALLGQFDRSSAALDRVVGGFGTGANADYWRRLNKGLCDRNEPPGNPPPKGGGCACVRYTISGIIKAYTLVLPDNKCGPRPDLTFTNQVYGPVTDVYIEPISPTSVSWRIKAKCRGLVVNDPDGSGCRPSEVIRTIGSFTSSYQGTEGTCPKPTYEVTSIVRTDGSPEQPCDDYYIPTPPPPPGWNKITINNFTWINEEGDSVVENADFNFGFAYINADLDLEFPIKVDIGEISFNGKFNVDKGAFEFEFGDINLNFGNPDKPDVRGPDNDGRELPDSDPDAPDRPDDVEPDPDVIEDDEPIGEEIVRTSTIRAVRVVVTNTGDFVDELFQDRNPNIAIPNYGYIQFFIRTEEDAGGWTADIPVKNRNHYIECPSKFGALFVRGTPRKGVQWSIKAYREVTRDVIAFPDEV